MDPISLATANALVGNKAETAALEITLAGPTLTCAGADIRIAVAGANFAVSIDGRPVSSHETHDLRAGQRLSIGTAPDGARRPRRLRRFSGHADARQRLDTFAQPARRTRWRSAAKRAIGCRWRFPGCRHSRI